MSGRVTIVVLSVLLTASLVGLALTSSWSPVAVTERGADEGDGATATSYLYVATASGGTITPGDDGTLVLTGTAPQITYFTDRPVRDAGAISVNEMIDVLFADDLPAPNAALTIRLDGEELVLPIELTGPEYDEAAGSLSFDIRWLTGTTPGLASFELDDPADAPATFGEAELFIDSGYNTCRLELTNSSDEELFFSTLEPTDPYTWDSSGYGVFEPSLRPGASQSWPFRFHSDSEAKSGSVTWDVGQWGSGDQVVVGWACRWSMGVVFATKTTCDFPQGFGCDMHISGSRGTFTVTRN
jgi:hypothetical protein